MLKIIKKVGLIIMSITTMITMSACSSINNDTAKEVCDALSEKYGETFVAVKIGDRLNTGSAKLYVHPEDNEELLFIAKIDKDTRKVEDDYLLEKVNYQVESIIKSAFEEEGINAASRCMVVTKDPLEVEQDEYTPKSFKEKYQFDHYTLYLILEDDELSSKKIINAVTSVNETIGVKLVIVGYAFDAENYIDCCDKMKENPEMGITSIQKYSPVFNFDINVDMGTCSLTEYELSEKIGR